MGQQLRNRFLSACEATVFLILFLISIPILIQVFDQFFSESSTFKQTVEPIQEFPTITICTQSKTFEYGVDVNISIGMHDYEKLIEKGKYEYSWKENGNFVENITLENFPLLIVGGFCYKITKNITYDIIHMDDGFIWIYLSFDTSIPFDELPDLDIFLTSEKNSPGVLKYEWMDGDEFHLKIPKVRM